VAWLPLLSGNPVAVALVNTLLINDPTADSPINGLERTCVGPLIAQCFNHFGALPCLAILSICTNEKSDGAPYQSGVVIRNSSVLTIYRGQTLNVSEVVTIGSL
jgi:hypothetical protein